MRKVIIACFLIILLSGCAEETSPNTIRVGALPTPTAEILEVAAEELESSGYEIKIVEYSNYKEPDEALAAGEIDANYYQTQSYLEAYNKENGTDLVAAGKIHYSPLVLYGGYAHTIDSLKDGTTILIPDDSAMKTRALQFLEELGFIELDPKKRESADISDITGRRAAINLIPMPIDEITQKLAYNDMSVLTGDFATAAALKIDGQYALAVESKEATRANPIVLAVRKNDLESDKTKALLKALQSERVKAFIDSVYDDNVQSSIR